MDDGASAIRAFTFTAYFLAVLFAAAAVTRIAGDGTNDRSFRMDASAFVWPVAWQFYTDSAHREFVVVYRFDDSTDTFHRLTGPIADPRHRWGLGHSAYAELGRLSAAVAAIPPGAWRPCAAATIEACAPAVASAQRTTVAAGWSALSGPTVFAVERPAVWREGRSRHIVRIAAVELVRPP